MFRAALRVRRPRRDTMDSQSDWPTRARNTTLALALLALVLAACPATALPADLEQTFEVWLVDQSNSPEKTYGGKISIYDGADISGRSASSAAAAATIDLG